MGTILLPYLSYQMHFTYLDDLKTGCFLLIMTTMETMTAMTIPTTDKQAVAMDRGVLKPVVITVTVDKCVTGGYDSCWINFNE